MIHDFPHTPEPNAIQAFASHRYPTMAATVFSKIVTPLEKAPPPEPAATDDPRIHKWATRLVTRLQEAGVRTSDILLTTSRFGYRSAYFAVPHIGEVRVSDHRVNDAHPTSDISISSPRSFIDLVRAYVYVHNARHPRKLGVIKREPFLMELGEAEEYIKDKTARREWHEMVQAARAGFWSERIATSGLDGDPEEIKALLRLQGIRPPHFPEYGEPNFSRITDDVGDLTP